MRIAEIAMEKAMAVFRTVLPRLGSFNGSIAAICGSGNCSGIFSSTHTGTGVFSFTGTRRGASTIGCMVSSCFGCGFGVVRILQSAQRALSRTTSISSAVGECISLSSSKKPAPVSIPQTTGSVGTLVCESEEFFCHIPSHSRSSSSGVRGSCLNTYLRLSGSSISIDVLYPSWNQKYTKLNS